MSTTNSTISLLGAVLTGALILSAPALATPSALSPASIPGVAAAPGPLASPFTASATIGVLATKPDIGLAGQTFTLSGSGLAPSKDVSIVWNTANVTWVVDARPDSVDYLGRKADKINVVLATTKTDAQGAFSITLKAPADFGRIPAMYAVVDRQQVTKVLFLVARTAMMSPKKGPIGMMISFTYTGLGSSRYE